MAVAIPVMMYVAAGLSAVAAVQQGKAASAAATFNAISATQDAAAARSEALAQSIQTQRETVLRIGAIRAAGGASGGTGEGSVLDVVADVAAQSELERQFVLYKGEARARGYERTAQLDFMQARAAREAGNINAATAALGGGYKAYSAGQALRVNDNPNMRRV